MTNLVVIQLRKNYRLKFRRLNYTRLGNNPTIEYKIEIETPKGNLLTERTLTPMEASALASLFLEEPKP